MGEDKTTHRFRVLYVRGSEEAGAAAASRAKLLAKAEDALTRIAKGLAARPRQDPERVSRRVAKAVPPNGARPTGSWPSTRTSSSRSGPTTS